MADEVRPGVGAAQVLKILAAGDADAPWTKWPGGAVSDRLASLVRDRLDL